MLCEFVVIAQRDDNALAMRCLLLGHLLLLCFFLLGGSKAETEILDASTWEETKVGHHPTAAQACACCHHFKPAAACYSVTCEMALRLAVHN